eukprot:73459-Pyramimonas_sp.AAC.1
MASRSQSVRFAPRDFDQPGGSPPSRVCTTLHIAVELVGLKLLLSGRCSEQQPKRTPVASSWQQVNAWASTCTLSFFFFLPPPGGRWLNFASSQRQAQWQTSCHSHL